MNKVSQDVIDESTVRSLIKVLLEDKTLGPAMVKVNPVVDPSAAVTDPSNSNFMPQDSVELKVAFSSMVDELPQDSVPDIYNKVKSALQSVEDKKGKKQMKDSNKKLEESIRSTVRSLLKQIMLEASPKLTPPSKKDPGAVEYPTRDSLVKYYKGLGFKTADAQSEADDIMKARPSPAVPPNFPIKKLAPQKAPEQVGMVPSRNPGSLGYSGAEGGSGEGSDVKASGKKNLMTAEEGGVTLKDLKAMFGYANENGVLQWINKILVGKVYPRIVMFEAIPPLVLETIKEWIEKHDSPENRFAELWEEYSQPGSEADLRELAEAITDDNAFREMLQPKMKKLDKLLNPEELMSRARELGLR